VQTSFATPAVTPAEVPMPAGHAFITNLASRLKTPMDDAWGFFEREILSLPQHETLQMNVSSFNGYPKMAAFVCDQALELHSGFYGDKTPRADFVFLFKSLFDRDPKSADFALETAINGQSQEDLFMANCMVLAISPENLFPEYQSKAGGKR